MFLNRGLSLMVHKTIHCQTACFSSLYVQQHAQSMFLVLQFMHILTVYICKMTFMFVQKRGEVMR